MLDLTPLVHDPVRGRYRSSLRLDRIDVALSVSPHEDEPPEAVEERLRQVTLRVLARLESILDGVSAELVPVKNEAWLRDGEAPLDTVRFKRKLRLTALALDADGAVTLHWLDGGLFWGHAVVAGLDDALELDYATIEG